MGDPAQVEAAFARITQHWGRLDVLFNNAGIAAKPAPIDEIPVEDWLAVMDRAMVDTGVAEKERGEIMATFRRAALMLVNVD